jgi:uncharacterized protein YyaL (SSP411 family)
LDDHANMARAALVLHEVTGEDGYLADARRWVAVLDRHYWDAADGGYFFTADDAEALITRTRSVGDNAVPAGNATMVGVLARLYHRTGESAYLGRAEALVQAFAPELARNFFPLATFLNNLELLFAPLQIVLVGEPNAPETKALLRAARSLSLPDRILTMVPPGGNLPEAHPAAGMHMVDGRATAYVCRGSTCSLPVTAPEALVDLLRQG